MEYCGIDLHSEYSQICIVDEGGEVVETSWVRTSRKALEKFFRRERMRDRKFLSFDFMLTRCLGSFMGPRMSSQASSALLNRQEPAAKRACPGTTAPNRDPGLRSRRHEHTPHWRLQPT